MAGKKFLSITDKKGYRTHAEVLNKVFNKKTRNGEPYKQAYNSVWVISETKHKKVWFPYLAVIDKNNGGWKSPKNVGWLNIPSPNKNAITEILLRDGKYYNPKKKDLYNDEVAVFVCTDIQADPNKYKFFGIFESKKRDKHGVKVWKKTSDKLDIKKWNEYGNAQ